VPEVEGELVLEVVEGELVLEVVEGELPVEGEPVVEDTLLFWVPVCDCEILPEPLALPVLVCDWSMLLLPELLILVPEVEGELVLEVVEGELVLEVVEGELVLEVVEGELPVVGEPVVEETSLVWVPACVCPILPVPVALPLLVCDWVKPLLPELLILFGSDWGWGCWWEKPVNWFIVSDELGWLLKGLLPNEFELLNCPITLLRLFGSEWLPNEEATADVCGAYRLRGISGIDNNTTTTIETAMNALYLFMILGRCFSMCFNRTQSIITFLFFMNFISF
jgi:hypothetical protein